MRQHRKFGHTNLDSNPDSSTNQVNVSYRLLILKICRFLSILSKLQTQFENAWHPLDITQASAVTRVTRSKVFSTFSNNHHTLVLSIISHSIDSSFLNSLHFHTGHKMVPKVRDSTVNIPFIDYTSMSQYQPLHCFSFII